MRDDIGSFERELDHLQNISGLRHSQNLPRPPDLARTIGFEKSSPGVLLGIFALLLAWKKIST